jgi:RTX calcium-binding nonapeptide repeat (4 copies)
MTRARFAAVALGVIVAGLLAGGGNASAPADEQRRPSCFGARATMVGTARADVLRGTQGRDVVVALGGADRVYGRGSDDLLCGGAGDDLLDGGPGRNRLHGGPGRDTCLRAASSFGCELPQKPPPLPNVVGTTLDGKSISLADLRGRPLFVNVWAAW